MKRVLSLFLAILFWSCSPVEDPESVDPKEVLFLFCENNKTSLKADGNDFTNVIARVPKDAGEIDITFTITAGKFVSTNALVVKEFADSINGNYRYASSLLRTDTIPKAAYLTAEVIMQSAIARRRIPISFIK